MTPERWQQVEELFHAALARERGQWATFLAQACAGDEPLLREVESLISFHDQPDNFIETPASDVAAELLAKKPGELGPGQQVAYYKILSSLGAGGMGEVYLAEDTRLGRRIALKLLPAESTADADRVERFEQEARAASALNHPNIVTIHEIGRADSTNFIATEFIDGVTLREHIAGREVELDDAIDIATQVASALEAAHAAGIVHRDIKPENIMIRRDRIVKVLDFGLAKLASPKTAVDGQAATRSMVKTNPGMVMGTVHYMSPEQARGQDVDEGTDIWSLGVTLYEMITSRMPFEGETRSHVVVSILESDPPLLTTNTEVPSELERIVTKALRKDREQRYQTACDMAIDLKNLIQQLQVDARLRPSLDTYGRASAKKSAAQTTQSAGRAPAARTAEVRTSKLTSTVTYLVSEIIRHKRGATLVAVAVLFAFAVLAYFPRNRAPGSGSEAIDSIAVLPFVNEGGDSNTEYLSDGISDGIINSLSRLPALKVMSFNSVLAYKGKQADPESIGKALNVRAVLMGRMTQQGDTLAISTELVDVRENRRLFSEQYNRKPSDIMAVQTEIALQISERLRLRLSGEEKKQLARSYPQDTEAYRLYSLGMYCGRQNTEEALEKGIEYFEQALKVDPNYTLAYTGLYGFYHQLGQGGRWLPTDARRKMEWSALKAVELDDALTEAHIKLATIRGINWDWAGSEKEYKRALELDPNSVGPNTSYSMFLLVVGRPDEAMAYANRAEEIDVDQKYASIVATVYLNKGDYDKAIELNLKKPHANQLVLREAYLAKGLYKEALELFEKEVLDDQSPVPWWGHPFRAYAYALAGHRDKALKILGYQQKAAKQRYISPFNFALIYTGLGDKDRAFEYLKKACEMHVLNLSHLRYGPLFGSLQSDPRYAELLRKMNLAL